MYTVKKLMWCIWIVFGYVSSFPIVSIDQCLIYYLVVLMVEISGRVRRVTIAKNYTRDFFFIFTATFMTS